MSCVSVLVESEYLENSQHGYTFSICEHFHSFSKVGTSVLNSISANYHSGIKYKIILCV